MKTISAERMAMVRIILTNAADLLVRQGTLGRSGSQCCNLTEDGDQCVVGLLVGSAQFEVGNSKLAADLSDLQYEQIFDTHIKTCRYNHLSANDRNHFVVILSNLQKIHDGLAASAAATCWKSDKAHTFVFAGIVGQLLVSVEDETMYGYEAVCPTVAFNGIRDISCECLTAYIDRVLKAIREFVELK